MSYPQEYTVLAFWELVFQCCGWKPEILGERRIRIWLPSGEGIEVCAHTPKGLWQVCYSVFRDNHDQARQLKG